MTAQDSLGKAGRLTFPIAMLAYPFYLWKRSPGKEGSHYDPKCNLFTPAEEPLVSHIFLLSQVQSLSPEG